MLQVDRGFIMLCDTSTEDECLRRQLFGDKVKRLTEMQGIQTGDIGFLFNFDKDELPGIFHARSQAQLNIERDAWGRRFSAQVRVELIGELPRIKDATYMLTKAGVRMGPMATGVIAPGFPVQDRAAIEKILDHFAEPIK